MLRDLVIRKIIKLNFDIFYKKSLCPGKMAITFACEVGKKFFAYDRFDKF
jgi:hypothetical protein